MDLLLTKKYGRSIIRNLTTILMNGKITGTRKPTDPNGWAARSMTEEIVGGLRSVVGAVKPLKGNMKVALTVKYKYRKRFSFKTRTRSLKHPPPDTMQQYKPKAWKGKIDNPPDRVSTTKTEQTRVSTPKKSVDEMDKKDLVNAMQREHPTRTLEVGTINANLQRVLCDRPELRSKVKTCLQEVVRHASRTKRLCQMAIGQYIEHLCTKIDHLDLANTTKIDEKDRALLDRICPRVSDQGHEEAKEDSAQEYDENANQDHQTSFISSLLICIYNKRAPTGGGYV
ncbi:hypothetical protein BGZ65_010641 [Modicella reniformis]|uniref:Uncharacterized protein n=1 Tax=Modicella reniformis TaxID=1440133 RepID=A0A9P6LTT8_9FUNG|nr:hypothetical protein BGZ65_010641 [Modicella reniformis]